MSAVLEVMKPVSASSLKYHSTGQFARERVRHDDTDMYRLLSPMSQGQFAFKVNGSLLHDGKVTPGMLRVSQPGMREHAVVNMPFDSIEIAIPGNNIRAMIARYDIRTRTNEVGIFKPLFLRNRSVMSLVRELHLAKHLKGNASQCFIDGISEALLALLLGPEKQPRPRGIDKGELHEGQFQNLIDYAEGCLDRKISLSDWADVIQLPITEFSRRFQKRTGDTPYCWLMNRRIERAKQLLRQGKMPLCDVAFAVGFGSQSHFTEAFRRRIGVAPAHWRSMQTNTSKLSDSGEAGDLSVHDGTGN